MSNVNRRIVIDLTVVSVSIGAAAVLTLFWGRSVYIVPFFMSAVIGIIFLLIEVGRMVPPKQAQDYSVFKDIITNSQHDLSFKKYLRKWLKFLPVSLLLGYGFWFASHMQDLLSLRALHTIIPSIPLTLKIADTILCIYIFTDFILYFLSRMESRMDPLFLKIICNSVAIGILLPIYIYVSAFGAIVLIKMGMDLFMNEIIALQQNIIHPVPILLGAIITILVLWIATFWMVKGKESC